MKKIVVIGVMIVAMLIAGAAFAWAETTPDSAVGAGEQAANQGSGVIVESSVLNQESIDAPAENAPVGQEEIDLASGYMNQEGAASGAAFVDEDGDGVCDLMGTGAGNGPHGSYAYGYAEGGCGAGFVDEDGDGVCDLMGDGAGNGPHGPFAYKYAEGGCGENFIDEDGDGVCDLMGTGAGNGPHGSYAYGYAEGGCGAGFVDEDGDGVCDLMGSGQGMGQNGRMNGGSRGGGRGGSGNSQ